MNILPNTSATHIDESGNEVEEMMFTYSEEEKQKNTANKHNAGALFRPNYVVIPHEYWRLSKIEMLLASFFATYSQRVDRIYFTNKQLADMFETSKTTISKAIKNLQNEIGLQTRYARRKDGGEVRFIKLGGTPWENLKEGIGKSSRRALGNLYGSNNKISNNKVTTNTRGKNKYSSIDSIGETELQETADKYQVTLPFVRSVLDDLDNYCKSKGRKYKDYYAALQNFVKKDAMSIKQGKGVHGYGNQAPRLVKVA